MLAAQECVQLHGGIGFTWEHPAHLYLKRAKAASLAFGTPGAHRAALAALVDLPAPPSTPEGSFVLAGSGSGPASDLSARSVSPVRWVGTACRPVGAAWAGRSGRVGASVRQSASALSRLKSPAPSSVGCWACRPPPRRSPTPIPSCRPLSRNRLGHSLLGRRSLWADRSLLAGRSQLGGRRIPPQPAAGPQPAGRPPTARHPARYRAAGRDPPRDPPTIQHRPEPVHGCPEPPQTRAVATTSDGSPWSGCCRRPRSRLAKSPGRPPRQRRSPRSRTSKSPSVPHPTIAGPPTSTIHPLPTHLPPAYLSPQSRSPQSRSPRPGPPSPGPPSPGPAASTTTVSVITRRTIRYAC